MLCFYVMIKMVEGFFSSNHWILQIEVLPTHLPAPCASPATPRGISRLGSWVYPPGIKHRAPGISLALMEVSGWQNPRPKWEMFQQLVSCVPRCTCAMVSTYGLLGCTSKQVLLLVVYQGVSHVPIFSCLLHPFKWNPH